ncbi:arsenate reductase (azurin) small subunit [Halorubrum tibetense]|uniref:Arsenate reductase (Azurin) small subunit n=1 Tax=Halorubrum tibetense TaxID=175631 RepID=A0ABD5S8V1_9EURY
MKDSDSSVTRRRLLGAVGTAGAASVAGCGFQPPTAGEGDGPAESPTERVGRIERYPRLRIAAVDEIDVGETVEFEYPLDGSGNFLTRLTEDADAGVGPEEGIVAFSNLCTHMGCAVSGNVDAERGTAGPCPCHYTSFDLSKGGLVVVGPATTDLPQVRLDVADGDVFATGMDGLVHGRRNNLADGEPVPEEGE